MSSRALRLLFNDPMLNGSRCQNIQISRMICCGRASLLSAWAHTLPLQPLPGRGCVGALPNGRQALQSPAPVSRKKTQSLSPALPSHKRRMASSSSGSAGDPAWLVSTRARQVQQRRTAGTPGSERWRAIQEEALQNSGDGPMDDPSRARSAHEVLRTDLASTLAFHEPQGDTMIVEGRPTQVIHMNFCFRIPTLIRIYAEPCACNVLAESCACNVSWLFVWI